MIQTSPWNPMESPGHDLQCRNADIDPGGVFSAYDVVGLPSGAGAAPRRDDPWAREMWDPMIPPMGLWVWYPYAIPMIPMQYLCLRKNRWCLGFWRVLIVAICGAIILSNNLFPGFSLRDKDDKATRGDWEPIKNRWLMLCDREIDVWILIMYIHRPYTHTHIYIYTCTIICTYFYILL